MARWTTIASLSVVIMILAGTVTGTSIALNHIPTFYKELTQTTVPKQDQCGHRRGQGMVRPLSSKSDQRLPFGGFSPAGFG